MALRSCYRFPTLCEEKQRVTFSSQPETSGAISKGIVSYVVIYSYALSIKVGVRDLIYNIETNGYVAMKGTWLINLPAMAFYLLPV